MPRLSFSVVSSGDQATLHEAHGQVIEQLCRRKLPYLRMINQGAERLFLARDRFGEKPLYLHEANGALYFASEAKALLQLPNVPRDVDLSAVWDYLAYRYVPGPRTLLQAVRKLPPATAAIWHRGHLQEIRYWSPPDKFPRAEAPALSAIACRIATCHAPSSASWARRSSCRW